MSKKVKAFLYNLISFIVFFVGIYFLIINFTNMRGMWAFGTAFVVLTILSPKFQAVKTQEGEKIFMKWIFLKGFKIVG